MGKALRHEAPLSTVATLLPIMYGKDVRFLYTSISVFGSQSSIFSPVLPLGIIVAELSGERFAR
jgi:hypothetical protein